MLPEPTSGGTTTGGRRVMFVNPSSGSQATDVSQLRKRFPEFDVVDDADDLEARVKDAIGHGAEVIGIAGGDGTVSSAVQRVRDSDEAMLVVPAGTRNPSAHDLGIDDIDAAA